MIETSTAVCDCANHAHVHLTDMVIGKPYDVEDDSRPQPSSNGSVIDNLLVWALLGLPACLSLDRDITHIFVTDRFILRLLHV